MLRVVDDTRVLLVEDDTAVREGLASSLAGHGYAVRAIPDGNALSEALETHRPDVAILDVGLGAGPDGFELARRIRASGDVPVIFVTAADSVGDRIRGFDAGGDDYVIKPFAFAELAVRLRAVLRRSGHQPRPASAVGDLVIDAVQRTVQRGQQSVPLTPTEFDLLTALATPPLREWSKRELLATVWGFDEYDPHLVEVHVSALRRKLEAHGDRLLHTVRSGGYTLRG
jgi:two-component system, OmpR family, response regulator